MARRNECGACPLRRCEGCPHPRNAKLERQRLLWAVLVWLGVAVVVAGAVAYHAVKFAALWRIATHP